MSLYAAHVKKTLTELLGSVALDVHYLRARGDYLYRRDAAGREVPVLDLLGGYGALILGHHHPAVSAAVRAALDAEFPIHAQFSLREASGTLAQRLSAALCRETGQEEGFVAIFSNSGAEAVEAAIKHAEMSRMMRCDAVLREIEANLARAAELERRGGVVLDPRLFSHPLLGRDLAGVTDLIARVRAHNAAQAARPPLFLALRRAFHGKSVATVQLTYGEMYRAPFRHLGIEVRFIDPADREGTEQRVAQEHGGLLDLRVEGGVVSLQERPLPRVTALLAEPIQGEGGIHCLDRDDALALRRLCNELECPLIVDEIQSGMGRTGHFLASTWIGLRGDYYTLSKSLGGGVAKIGVTLIRRPLFLEQFGVIHSSTFGEDDLSAVVGLAVLDVLEADDGAAYAVIRRRGEALRTELEAVASAFPDVIKEVRGRGLMLGIEFHDQPAATSMVIRGAGYNGSLGYLVAGYLLQVENIRLAPPASAPNVLRLEPSMYLGEEEIHRTGAALRRVCEILRGQDALHLVHPIVHATRPPPRDDIRDFRQAFAGWRGAAEEGSGAVRKVAFINHLITPQWLTQVDPSLAGLDATELRNFVLRMAPKKRAAPYDPIRIRSPLGGAVDFSLYPLAVCSEQMAGYLRNGELDGIRAEVEERVLAAGADGCEVVGLGMYTSIVTNNCTSLRTPGIALTSGNALTVGMGLEALERAMAERGIDPARSTVVVAGAAGNIAATYASLLAARLPRLILLGSGREDSLARLRRTAEMIYGDVFEAVAAARGEPAGLEALLAEAGLLSAVAPEGRQKRPGTVVAARVVERYGEEAPIRITTDRGCLREADLVVCAANADTPFLTAGDFKEGAVVLDIAVPANVDVSGLEARPDLLYLQGGIVATPNGEGLHPGARATLDEGQLFACMAETAVLGLAGIGRHYSYGAISRAQVREISALAAIHGFRLADYKQNRSL